MSPSAAAPLPENAADLRMLYRAAEARAARLRVLADAGQALAAASPDTLDKVAADVARAAAHLAGFASGHIAGPEAADRTVPDGLVLDLRAPGSAGGTIGVLVLEDRRGEPSAEDRETLDLMCQLLGASLSARARERRLALLLGELLRGHEVERSRIAHELHDGVAQSAAALMRRLELAEDGDPADLGMARDQARALVIELRRVIAGMRPPVLDDLGLVPALRQLAAEAEASGLAVTLDLALAADERLPPVTETALFRVVQEALNNTRAHAGAGARAAVCLTRRAGFLVLSIRDDGCGFDPAGLKPHCADGGLGLAYMRERIALLGGTFTIASEPGRGCALHAELPLA
jgi:signal transduction histidine kinase